MSYKALCLFLSSAVCVLSLTACKDDEEEKGFKNLPPFSPVVSLGLVDPNDANNEVDIANSYTIYDLKVTLLDSELIDPDGDELSLVYEWFLDGELTEYTQDEIKHDVTTKGQVWNVYTYTTDGSLRSKPSEHSITILNSLPELTSWTATPDVDNDNTVVTTLDDLSIEAGQTFDADGDAVTLSYKWKVDGTERQDYVEQLSIPSTATAKGQLWTVEITPNDGEENGPAVVVPFPIINIPPVISSVSITPADAYEDSTLSATYVAEDTDTDELTPTYTWTVNGEIVMVALEEEEEQEESADTGMDTGMDTGAAEEPTMVQYNGPTLTGEHFSKGDEVTVTVMVNDGEDDSVVDANASATITIQNSLPTLSSVEISPEPAYADSDLTCSYSGEMDLDGDPISVIYSWLKDGLEIGTDEILAGAALLKGDEVVCSVMASDGTEDGSGNLVYGTATEGNIVIANSAPVITDIRVDPDEFTTLVEAATTDETLYCVVESTDVDGDSVAYTYSWTVNGVEIGHTDQYISAADFSWSAGDEVSCSATPSDGVDSGDTAVASNSVTLDATNTAPVISTIAISPDPATTADTLSCDAVASDAEGDAITFTYTWSINGVTVGHTGDTLSAADETLAEGDVVACIAVANDGNASSPAATAPSVTLAAGPNTAPVIDSISISPDPATTADTLSCDAVASDAEGDAITFTYTWSINGVTVGHIGGTLSAADATLADGDVVACGAVANDGSEDSVAATSADVTLTAPAANSAPVITDVVVNPNPATPADTLLCSVSATDVDGDALTFTYSWTVNGVAVASHTSGTLTTTDTALATGDEVSCSAVANDGTDNSTQESSSIITLQ